MKNEGYEILIVEDSPTQTEQLKNTLNKHGYNVATAYNGKEALSYLSGHIPQMVISDIVMPEMNGYELCKEIKAGENTMDIPVILLTALSRPEDVLEGISCGANNFITKPYREDYLISHIEQILVNRKLVKNERVRIGVEIIFGGKRHFITAGQQQMFTLLISTYEAAVQRNNELKKLNEHLEELVIERTKELSAENAIRKRTEDQVKRLNRIYALQCEVNQATVKIHDINKLLKEICIIAIDKGKFQSAWIGIVNNRTKKIMTSATAGLTNDLIEADQNQNLIAKVIRSGKHFISNNINDDTSINEIWKQNSLSLGFKSFAVLPLIVHEKLIGGFCIYSNEVDFFDDPEINLLDEMAIDVSFALEYIQKEFERRFTEEALRQSELRFKQVSENAHEWIWEVDSNGLYTYVSPIIKELLGYRTEEILGIKYFYDFFDPKNKEELKHAALEGFARKESFRNFINCNIHKDGRKIILSTTAIPILDKENNLLGYRGTDVDVTERIRAEESLRESEEKYRTITQSANDAIFTADSKGIIIDWNRGAEKIFGYTEAEITGKELNIVIPQGYRKQHMNGLKRVEQGGEHHVMGRTVEFRGLHKNGKEFPLELSLAEWETTNGKFYTGIIRDITDRKQAEEELIKAKEQAEGMNRLKNYFLSNMSHELRTPLVPVLGFAELLQQEITDQKHLEFVNQIMEGGQRLNNTLNAILEFSKLESDKMVLNLSPLNLAEEITKNIESIKPKAHSKNLFLKTEMRDKYLKANIDTELFGEVLFHIISNGIKFTKEGGVLVRLHHKKEQDREWAVTQIIDTGIGIPKENIDKIFGAFRQASEGHSRNYEGTGLGLTISQRIIEMLNGKIQVESEEGVGSIFSIWFPAVLDENQIKIKVEEKRRTTVIDSPTKEEKGLKKVLVVEDNLSNRLFINRCLSTYVRILEAEDGISGVTMASKEHFDLILMDINLSSGIDGIDAMHQIKKLPGYAGVPIVAVTAFAMSADKERFLNEGFDDYLAKPFTKDNLINLVEKILAKDRGFIIQHTDKRFN